MRGRREDAKIRSMHHYHKESQYYHVLGKITNMQMGKITNIQIKLLSSLHFDPRIIVSCFKSCLHPVMQELTGGSIGSELNAR